MIVDAFLYNGEELLLETRFRELKGVVDHFIVVEGKRTFTNQPKPSGCARAMAIAERCGVSFSHYEFSPMREQNNEWGYEYAQRDAMLIPLLEFGPKTIVILSDCDEIPRATTILRGIDDFSIIVMRQLFFYYSFNHKVCGAWNGPRICTLNTLRYYGPQNIRGMSTEFIENGGWHCSYFGGPYEIIRKLTSFSHQEYNKDEFTNKNHIEKCIEGGLDLFNREEMQIERVDGLGYCPLFLLENNNHELKKALFL